MVMPYDSLCCLHRYTLPGELCPAVGPQQKEGRDLLEQAQRRGTKINSWTEHFSSHWSLKDSSHWSLKDFFSQLGEEEAPGFEAFQCSKGAMENGDRIFSRVCCDSMRSIAIPWHCIFIWIALIWPPELQTCHSIPSRTWHLTLLYSSAFWHLQSIFALFVSLLPLQFFHYKPSY